MTFAGTVACQSDRDSPSSNDEATAANHQATLAHVADASLLEFLDTLHASVALNPASGDAVGRLAMAYDANGFDEAAASAYQQAAANAPTEFKWHYLLALRLQKNGALDHAIEVAQNAIERNNAYPALHIRLGNWLLDAGDADGAIAHFAHAVTLGGGPPAEFGVARATFKRGDPESALRQLQNLVALTNHPAVHLLSAEVWRALGNEREAREALGHVVESKKMWFDDPLLTEMLSYVKARGRKLHDVELMLASGLVDDALTTLHSLVAEARADFNVHYHFALAYMQRQEFDAAKRHLLTAVELEPVHFPSHLLLASLYQGVDDNASASAHLERVLAIYPKLQIGHQELGFVRLRLGDTSAALTSFERAIELDSTAPNVHYYAGVILGERGECDRAIAKFETTLALDTAHEKARMGIEECTRVLNQP